MTATTGSASATATLTSPTSSTSQSAHRRYWDVNGTVITAATYDATVPTGSIAVGPTVTLGPDDVLRRGTSTVATAVTSATAQYGDTNGLDITWVDGVC